MKRRLSKGNFIPKNAAEAEEVKKELSFEEEVVKKLGGSFGYVRGGKPNESD